MICVECMSEVTSEYKKKVICKYCNKKIDKYRQTSNSLKYIDCLLLKPQIFVHFLINFEISNIRLVRTSLLQLLSIFTMNSAYANDKKAMNVTLDINISECSFQILSFISYFTLMCLSFRKLGIRKALFTLLFSSFFNLFKLMFSLWRYESIYSYLILEVLNFCSNVAAFKCFDSDHKRVFTSVLTCKVLSYAITVFITSQDTLKMINQYMNKRVRHVNL